MQWEQGHIIAVPFLCSGNPRLAVYSQFYEHDEVVEIETSHMNMRNYV